MAKSKLSDKMRERIIWAAEREVPLFVSGPHQDIQICGSIYDVRISSKDGEYLGWTSKAGAEEAKALHKATPSKLAMPVEKTRELPFTFQVELALRRCRNIESSLQGPHRPGLNDEVSRLRSDLEVLYEQALTA